MKKMGLRQMVLSIAGIFFCQISLGGCYFMIPAWFAAVYLQESARQFLWVCMGIGIVAGLPLSSIVKYGMALLVTAAAIHLSEWVEKRCYTVLAAASASIGTFTISVFGGIFDFRNQIGLIPALSEAVFIFGAVIVFARMCETFLGESFQMFHLQQAAAPGGVPENMDRGRLLEYARSFERLSRTFLTVQSHVRTQPEELQEIRQKVAGQVCIGCDACALCWKPENRTMQNLFSGLIAGLQEFGHVEEEIHDRLQEQCPYAVSVEQEAVRIFEQTRLNEAWYKRLTENREMIAQQFDAMAYIMQDCARGDVCRDEEEQTKRTEIRYRLKQHGIRTESIHIYENRDGYSRVSLTVRSRFGSSIPVKIITETIRDVLNVPVHGHRDNRVFVGQEETELLYEEDPAFYLVHGIAKDIMDGQAVSGDNFSVLQKEDGEAVLSLSDGMGSGTVACRESEMVLDLLERFIEAGFSKETAIGMLNSAMVIRGEEEQYSTVDLTSVDLHTGKAEFYKIGAAATFIRHKNGEVECLLSTSLPVGVNFELEMEKASRQLVDGDILVMVTDGVLECLQAERPEERFLTILSGMTVSQPGLLANKLLEQVREESGQQVPDDRMILTAAIWENL